MTEAAGPAFAQDGEIVWLPVPRKHFGVAFEAIVSAVSSSTTSHAESQPEVDDSSMGEAETEWTRDEVRRLKQTVGNPAVRKIIEVAIQRGDEPISIREVERLTGRSRNQIKGDLAGLTQAWRRDFPHRSRPINAVWGANGKAEMSYVVPADLRRWWQEV